MPTVDEIYKQSEQFRREGKSAEAITALEEVLKLDNSHVLAHMTLARLLCKANRPLDGVPHSEQACQLEPNEVFNWTALSETYQKAFEATQDRMFILKAEEAKTRSHQLQWQKS
ncbi:tetratricopeptide repeat protein [Anatilimnocola floriformis]|uniref:tetratricopeptide repeat protein n=1 Tax=Anatilimnocola floriformis TaxID=2948575 RepID=UPI0020C2D398|nr:tetratricopeptide repeat protein [Anatilimnocola floriformis]